MNTKTNAEMLKSIKQSNKVVREGRAVKEGFKDSKDLITFLEGQISIGNADVIYTGKPASKSKPSTKKTSNKPVIHVVDVLDASGSMQGSKYDNAVKGINIGVKNLKQDKAEVEYTYTLCDFSSDIIFRSKMDKIEDIKTFKGHTRGATALYDAIGEIIELVQKSLRLGDKVLVNIYTDGGENGSRRFTSSTIAKYIEDLSSKGWTFTFIGTQGDVEFAQRQLKFDISNTLVHDNTGAGLEKAFATNSVARASYSAKVESGQDVSLGFYKDIN